MEHDAAPPMAATAPLPLPSPTASGSKSSIRVEPVEGQRGQRDTPRSFTVIYRGALQTCNYSCSYCPFAKTSESPEHRRLDEDGLAAFVQWVERHPQHRFELCFTPWGEALVFQRYWRALQRLSHLDQVEALTVQTNLHAKLDWLSEADTRKLSLWCTYHPSETPMTRFLGQLARLQRHGVRHSVGMVAKPRLLPEIEALRAALPPATYLWLNAYSHGHRKFPYTADQLARLRAIDPHVDLNLRPHPSRGAACRAGHTSFTVDETGAMRRCHFIGQVLGHIHQADWVEALQPRPCSRTACDCHIGYSHLAPLALERVFGPRPLQRIPLAWPTQAQPS